jgi:hypothetical protein
VEDVFRLPEGEIDSQLPPFDTLVPAVYGVLLDAVTLNVCEEGADPFTTPLKLSADAPRVNVPPDDVLPLTVTTTGTTSGLFPTPELKVTLPTFTPFGRVDAPIVTKNDDGLFAELGVTVSQFVTPVTDTGIFEPSLTSTWIFVDGFADPAVYDTFTTPGFANITAAEVTSSVTLTVCDPALVVTTNEPLFVPEERPVASADTVSSAGPVPLVGVTVNQLPTLLVMLKLPATPSVMNCGTSEEPLPERGVPV